MALLNFKNKKIFFEKAIIFACLSMLIAFFVFFGPVLRLQNGHQPKTNKLRLTTLVGISEAIFSSPENKALDIVSLSSKLSASPLRHTYSQKGAAFVLSAKDDRALTYKIGALSGAVFLPEMSIEKWDGEVKMNIMPNISKVPPEDRAMFFDQDENGEEKVIKFETPDLQYIFYDKTISLIDDRNPDRVLEEVDGYEFEFALKEQPDTDRFEFDMETENLDFYYQPPLNVEYNDYSCTPTECHGHHRPENVVGSYAVYYKDNLKGDYTELGGKNYMTGKAFHIYRPKAFDADGDWVWCNLEINQKRGKMIITVPDTFLAKAVYPVVVDPTFGNTHAGTSYTDEVGNEINGSIFASGEAGTVNYITFYMYPWAGTDYSYAIYDSSFNLVASTTTWDAGTSAQWCQRNFSSPPSISNANYWLVENDNDTNNWLYYDSGDTSQSLSKAQSYSSWPNPLTSPSYGNLMYSVYADFNSLSNSTTVSTFGTQTSTIWTPATNQYVGGGFAIISNTGSRNVTSITITESGTIDAQNNLSNIKLYYDLDTSAPYDCASENYENGATKFGSTDSDGFSGANGTSVFSGSSVAVTATQSMCVYVVFDASSNATVGDTVEISINNPSTDVTVSSGSIGPATAISISGTSSIYPLGLPYFVSRGGRAGSQSAVTPEMPAGVKAGDILLLFTEKYDSTAQTLSGGSESWSAVPGSNVGISGYTYLSVFWARASQDSPTSPTTNDVGDHQIGVIIAIRGAVATGNPWDAISTGTENTSDTSGSITGTTTWDSNRLVVAIMATDLPEASGTTNFSSWANSSLLDVQERVDETGGAGNGGGIGVATGIKSTAGAYGATTVTLAASARKAFMTIAIKGEPPPVVYPLFTQNDWRWYDNADSVQPGSALAAENTAITSVTQGSVLRLRMNALVSAAALATTTRAVKLQYGTPAGDGICSNIGSWTDVGAIDSGVIWRGYNNTPSDGAAITSLLLASSTVKETYEEANPSASNTLAIPISGQGEWDWVIQNNGAASNTAYCFRMVTTTGSFYEYETDGYPKLTTQAESGVTGYLGKTADGWSGAIPVYMRLNVITSTSYPYARASTTNPAGVTFYTDMTWDAATSAYKGVIYPGSNYCNGCADPNTGAFKVTVQLDNNADFGSIDYSSTTSGFTTFITRRWNAVTSSALGYGTEFNPTWNTDHWDYLVEDLSYNAASGQSNVAVAIPFYPTTANITNMAVTVNGKSFNQGAAASTTDCWWWDSGQHTLYIQDDAVSTTYKTVVLDFDSDTDLFATRFDRLQSYNLSERLFYNGLIFGNQFLNFSMAGGGHEASGAQFQMSCRNSSNNDLSLDCVDRVAVQVDDTIQADGSGYYGSIIKWKQDEWADYIISENNNSIQVAVHSDDTASTGWAQQLNNGISATRYQTFYASKRYLKNEYIFTNEGVSTYKYPFIWTRQQWLGTDRATNDVGYFAGDTSPRNVEIDVSFSTLNKKWFTTFDTGDNVAMGVIFDSNDPADIGYFTQHALLTNSAPWAEWPIVTTSYSSTNTEDIAFTRTWNSVPAGASTTFTFWQWGYCTTSWAAVSSSINIDYNELNTGAEETVSCSVTGTSTSFGAMSSDSIFTSTPNSTTTFSCTYAAGCTLYVNDTGDTSNPGLATSSPAYLIPSPDAAYSAYATLSAGTEGYGIQVATSSAGSGSTLSIAARYLQTGNAVGGLTIASTALASSTATFSDREVVVTHKAAVSALTQLGTYSDTITYSCLGN